MHERISIDLDMDLVDLAARELGTQSTADTIEGALRSAIYHRERMRGQGAGRFDPSPASQSATVPSACRETA